MSIKPISKLTTDVFDRQVSNEFFYLEMSLLELATLSSQYNDNDNLHSIFFAL